MNEKTYMCLCCCDMFFEDELDPEDMNFCKHCAKEAREDDLL